MPILNVENTKLLHFGFGDISVAPGSLEDYEDTGCVVFTQLEQPIPIGTYTKYEKDQQIEVSQEQVRMVFEKPESINVVIRALEEAKRIMLKSTTK